MDRALNRGICEFPCFQSDGGSVGAELIPLTIAQRGIWDAEVIGNRGRNSMALYVEIEGVLDAAIHSDAVRSALTEFSSGLLRVALLRDGPYLWIDRSLGRDVLILDYSSNYDPVGDALEWMHYDMEQDYELINCPLWTSALIKLGEARYFWYLKFHHIAMDGHATYALCERVATIYNARTTGSNPLSYRGAGLAAIVQSELDYRDSPRFIKDRDYWLDKLSNGFSIESLSPGVFGEVKEFTRVVSGELSDHTGYSLRKSADIYGVSISQLVMSGVGSFISAMQNSSTTVSMPVSSRASMVLRNSGGMLANALPVRMTASGSTSLRQVVASISREMIGAMRHQRYRIEDIRRDIGVSYDVKQPFGPAVNVMIFEAPVYFGGAPGKARILSSGIIEDIQFNLYQTGREPSLSVDILANAKFYDEAHVTWLHERLCRYLDVFFSSDPDTRVDAIELLDEYERHQILSVWNDTTHALDTDATLVSL
ncbi:condensation domain-containing protein, partial [Nocardia vinacea]|uniref:condensation domain-containing protein n=1 Tax=Nocardia vinacea TaxID=96468 RepID=UPI0033D0ABD4